MERAVYAAIAEEIRLQIVGGELRPGNLLPSENTLCAKYGVTRTTIRRALALLLKNNYIISIPGKGYFVNPPTKNQFLLRFDELSCFRDRAQETRLLGVKIIKPTVELMIRLQIMENKKVVNIKRVFVSKDGKFIGFDNKYVNYYTGIPIVEKEIHYITFPNIFANKTSLHELNEELVMYVDGANAYISSLLGVEAGSPVMVVEQTMKDEEGVVLGWAETYYRGDFFEITADSMQAGERN